MIRMDESQTDALDKLLDDHAGSGMKAMTVAAASVLRGSGVAQDVIVRLRTPGSADPQLGFLVKTGGAVYTVDPMLETAEENPLGEPATVFDLNTVFDCDGNPIDGRAGLKIDDVDGELCVIVRAATARTPDPTQYAIPLDTFETALADLVAQHDTKEAS